MNDSTSVFKNASFLIYGASFLALMVSGMRIPGLHHVCSIVWALFAFWAGLTLRRIWPRLRWWVWVPVLSVALLCISLSLLPGWRWIQTLPFFWSALACLGFVNPLEKLKPDYLSNGWAILLAVLSVIFCYIAVCVATNLWCLIPPEREDERRLFISLMSPTQLLLMILAVYLAVIFSFTKIGQWMGHFKWLKWMVIAIGVPFYLNYLYIFAQYLNHPYSWCSLLRVIIQPFNVYLCVVLYRRIFKMLPWKECVAELL